MNGPLSFVVSFQTRPALAMERITSSQTEPTLAPLIISSVRTGTMPPMQNVPCLKQARTLTILRGGALLEMLQCRAEMLDKVRF